MKDLCDRLAVAGLTVAALLLAARPATAQYVVAPDRSSVYIGQKPPTIVRMRYSVTPVVVPGTSRVRISGSYSGVLVNPNAGYPGTGFVKPFYANERAKAANFYGSPNYNPAPVITGPFRVWW